MPGAARIFRRLSELLDISGASATLNVTGARASGNTLIVDDAIGNDGIAATARLDLPYATLGAAKAAAVAGDTIKVRPGSYTVTDSILKNGVDWEFDLGAEVSMTQDTDSYGILDDKGVAIVCSVRGLGSFTVTTTAASLPDSHLQVVGTTHADSVMYVEALDLTLTGAGSGTVNNYTVLQLAGVQTVRARNIVCTGQAGLTQGVWWGVGEQHIFAEYIYGTGYGVAISSASAPTGDLYVSADLIESPGVAVRGFGTDSTSAAWITAKIVKATGTGLAYESTSSNLNRVYITAQKLFGRVDNRGGLLYVTADKQSAIANGTGSSSHFFYQAGSTADSYIQIKHFDSGAFTGSPFSWQNGTGRIIGGEWTANSSSTAIASNAIAAGTLSFIGFKADTSAASINAFSASKGTLILRECTVTSHASFKDVVQSSTGTIVVTDGRGSGTNGAFTTTGTIAFSGRGANAAAALAVDVGTAGAVVVNGGALGTPSSGTLTNCTGLPQAGTVGLTTADSPQFAGIELGNASDTTISRVSAGVIAVEGIRIVPVTSTEQSATGTVIDFSIPTGVKRITLNFFGVSVTNTSDDIYVQLGDGAPGIEVTGYLSGATTCSTGVATKAATAGFVVNGSALIAADTLHGSLVLVLEDASDFTWISTHSIYRQGTGGMLVGAGSKQLTAELTTVRLTFSSVATNSFDAGVVSVTYT